jgi:hypothetical protein
MAVPVLVESTGGTSLQTEVVFTSPRLTNFLLEHEGQEPLDQRGRRDLTLLAVLRAVQEDEDFFSSRDPITIDGEELQRLREPRTISDQSLRRYIARKLYLLWSEETFNAYAEFGSVDAALTGAGARDFLRNLQVLAQEGYADLEETMDPGFPGFMARGTAKLVRHVERYGAAREDVENPEDYGARLRAVPALARHAELLLLQRGRLAAAGRPEEIVSVFRAVMPTVEAIVRDLLRAAGDGREHSSLGPMIASLRNRGVGDRGVWAQLATIKNSARDIDLHGQELPMSVLRIATEVSFELAPQLGLLFPADGS